MDICSARGAAEIYTSEYASAEASARKKIIIVGAGIAGISAAKEICKNSGFDVTILEASQWTCVINRS